MTLPSRFAFTKRSIDAIPPHDPASPSREREFSDVEQNLGLNLVLQLWVSRDGAFLYCACLGSRGRWVKPFRYENFFLV